MVQILQRPQSKGERFLQSFEKAAPQIHDILSGVPTEHSKQLSLQARKSGYNPTEQELIEAGLSPEQASLYTKLNTGSKTKLVGDILETQKRGLAPKKGLSEQPQEESSESPNRQDTKPKEISPEQEIETHLKDQDYGLTPAERVKRESERYKIGLESYQEAGKKLRSFSKTKQNLDELEKIAKTGKLPKGLGRLNVDKEGNLKLPFLASKEAQRFVKIVNEFASGAKDTYGSRVTNFDLAQYLKQFPNLLNSEDGIRDLIDHIKIVNDIDSIYYKNLKSVYDKAGGSRKIDSDVAERIAEKMSENKVGQLSKKFDSIGTVEGLPPAHKNKGEQFQDEETGDVFVSDGKSWVKRG